MALDAGYTERVYAGVLGKIIGVYLGRPFEGWWHDGIMERLGEVQYYVHDRLGAPLIVTDDDISGTFGFLRALEDYGPDVTAAQIGQTWLNEIIEGRTILWWGGMGMSTEHTAYLRLKRGVPAPCSGSIALNGQVVAEQIGAQIFIDGWGLVNPGDPERAAHYARLAGSVSHDGEAIYGAQVVAALVAQAFVESDIDRLLDTAVGLIPRDSVISGMIADIREWHAAGNDWKQGFRLIERDYGYDKYGGNCHMVPNHGLIVHALLHGGGDFQRSLMVVNTCGWDTDCNSANVGCILGVRNGLAGIDEGPDWRGPVADRLYLPTAEGGRCVTDAASIAVWIANLGRRIRGEAEERPKDGARFHFSLPGSVQGFQSATDSEAAGVADIVNLGGQLEVFFRHLAPGRVARAVTETFPGPEARKMGGYGLLASPTLYPGQTLRAHVLTAVDNLDPVSVCLTLGHYDAKDEITRLGGEGAVLEPGDSAVLEWVVPDLGGFPIVDVGIDVTSEVPASGAVTLDWLTWDGCPTVEFRKTEGKMWREAWVNGVSDFMGWGEPFRIAQNEGTGLLMQGGREWVDYRVSSIVVPHLAESAGIAARVQGMRRYYALLLHRSGELRLVRALDGDTVLAQKAFPWSFGQSFELAIEVEGTDIRGYVNGRLELSATDDALTGGGIAYVLEEGRMGSEAMRVGPLVR